MSQLTIITDVLRGTQHKRELRQGARLSDELMRLYPDGIPGGWRIYRDDVRIDSEIAALDLPHEIVELQREYILVHTPGGAAALIPIAINLVTAIALTIAAHFLTPKRRTREEVLSEQQESPNNTMAGQTNLLRAGGRIPDILGRVRAWPDVLNSAVEEWWERVQQIEQFFVLGLGYYDVSEAKLGETRTDSILNAGAVPRPPNSTISMRTLKAAVEVNAMSLMIDTAAVVSVGDVDFHAGTNTMVTDTAFGVVVGDMIRIKGTANAQNEGFFKILALTGGGPYTYTLDRPLADELNSDPLFSLYEHVGRWSPTGITYLNTIDVRRIGGTFTGTAGTPENGWLCDIDSTTPADRVRGYVRNFYIFTTSPRMDYWNVELFDGSQFVHGFSSPHGVANAVLDFFQPFSSGGGGTAPPAGPIQPTPSGWFRVPIDDPLQVWIDIAFPQGLLNYSSGNRAYFNVDVKVEFKRPDSEVAQVTYTRSHNYASAGPLRFTHKFPLTQLIADGLPASPAGTTSGIDVQLTRTTAIPQDTNINQYITETIWQRLAGFVLVEHTYTDVTLIQLTMSNERGAVSMGETSFNVIAQRKLPTYSGGVMGTALVATRKWADAIVYRMSAPDGGRRDYADIDLAGIYALQTQLDALEPSDPAHPQGQISMTLDQMQDIDNELAQIADVVRAQVYRVGRKLFVSRDQAVPTATALFNARAKSPEGEATTTRMTSDSENDGATVQWIDELHGWKKRTYTYPTTAINPIEIGAQLANWAQAYRRARFEYNRLIYRREQMSCEVTEDGRLCRPGDVIMLTDDVANLASAAGEVLAISGLTLVLDRDVTFGTGAHTILLRHSEGRSLDFVPCTAVAGSANRVQLTRAPSVEIKGRDLSLGTLFAFYNDAAANVRRWLLTSVEAAGPYVRLSAVNDTTRIYDGDAAALPSPPAGARVVREIEGGL